MSPKSKLDMVACDDVWRHDSMKRGPLVEDEGTMTNYASQAAARSPKFNVLGRNTRPGKEYKLIRKVIICEQIILT